MGTTVTPPETDGSIQAHELRVPRALAKGQYEKIDTATLVDHYKDVRSELERRIAAGGRPA